MAIPVARVHLKVAHASLPALLPTPPKWKMLPLFPAPPPPPCAASILSKPLPAKTSRADSDERWDAHKAKPPACCPASSASSVISEPRKNARTTSLPLLKPGRADAVERWDVHKKHRPPQPQGEPLDDGESSSIGSNDMDTEEEEEEEEEEILWKPRAYAHAGPGFVVAAPETSMIPMPTSFLVGVA